MNNIIKKYKNMSASNLTYFFFFFPKKINKK